MTFFSIIHLSKRSIWEIHWQPWKWPKFFRRLDRKVEAAPRTQIRGANRAARRARDRT
jgi:hypothetical protein